MNKQPTPRGDAHLSPTASLTPHAQASLVPVLAAAERVALHQDISRRGVVEPLAITASGVVLDGHARLQAALELGLETVPVWVVAPDDEREFILLAAIQRRQLTPSQRAALAVELDEYRTTREQARSRQLANLRQNPEVATSPPRGKTRVHLAKLGGVGERTIQDAITVYENDPDLFEKVKHRTGNVSAHSAASEIRRAQRDAATPPAPPLPQGPYDVILADPPWQMGNPNGKSAPEQHYATLPLQEIKSKVVPAAANALLFLWAVNSLLPEALEVMTAWGFTYITNLVWVKPSIGPGRLIRNQHELLLIGRRGNYPAPYPKDLPSSVIEAKRGRHSEKPACVYELIERMYPHASKLELFARGTPRPGWAAWGNEVTP